MVCLPLIGPRALYSHKYICPVQGLLEIDGKAELFQRDKSYGLLDIHKGYYPYALRWYWATGGEIDRAGTLVGFNLTDNQVKDQDRYNENCVWVDGKIHLLPPVKFSLPDDPAKEPWRVSDSHGMVDMIFKPEVQRTVDINALIIRSKYRAPFGSFSGRLQTQAGQEVAVASAFGMCENMYLRT